MIAGPRRRVASGPRPSHAKTPRKFGKLTLPALGGFATSRPAHLINRFADTGISCSRNHCLSSEEHTVARWSCKDSVYVGRWLAALICAVSVMTAEAQEPAIRPGERSVVRTRPDSAGAAAPRTLRRARRESPESRRNGHRECALTERQDPPATTRTLPAREAAPPATAAKPEQPAPEVIEGPPVPEGYVLDLDDHMGARSFWRKERVRTSAAPVAEWAARAVGSAAMVGPADCTFAANT